MSKEAIQQWWAENPMTYGNIHGQASYSAESGVIREVDLGSRAFFEQVDQTFYQWNKPLHTERGFFAKIFQYETYKEKEVLEIGCGMGTMAMNWAQNGAHVTAVDLNPVAVAQTTKRFNLFGLQGKILLGDSNSLYLNDNSFDYVYSWGVLHHSPNLERSIAEMLRTLKSGGRFGIMLYNRHSLLYWHNILYLEGFLHGESRFLNALQLASRYTDGGEQEGNPHTWPVTRREVCGMLAAHCRSLKFQVFGTELDGVLESVVPKMHQYIPKLMKKSLARRWGWSLWTTGTKI